jgi:hypothetical protein
MLQFFKDKHPEVNAALPHRLRERAAAVYQWLRWRPNAAQRSRGNTMRSYEERVYSQHGEDGILRELFYRLGVREGFFAEFGIGNGTECNSALLARNYRWRGMMIEADERFFRDATEFYRPFPNVRVRSDFVYAENIVGIFREEGVPEDLDFLSIDIDGNDYWIWKTLGAAFRPKVVTIEYNCHDKPPIERVMQYDPNHRWKGDWNYGGSLAAMTSLGAKLGYSLIGTESSGVNAFFVRDDLVGRAGFPVVTAAEAYTACSPVTFWARPKPVGPWATEL